MTYGPLDGGRRVRSDEGLSPEFAQRLENGLQLAEGRRRRTQTLHRWRSAALIILPIVTAACWAALPWTFAIGLRSFIGFAGYLTLMLAIAGRVDATYLAFLGLGFLPMLIDILLFVGVVSWLIWASRLLARPEASVTKDWFGR